MNAGKMLSALSCAGILLTMIVFQGHVSTIHAADVKELLRQVNKELRQANRDMFGGKTEKAVAALEPIRARLIEAKQADPNHPQIPAYENKYKKLVKDLERRTGKDLGGGTLTAAGGHAKVDLPPKPETGPAPKKQTAAPAETALSGSGKTSAAATQLPYAARRPIRNAGNDLARIDSALEKLSDPKWNKDQLLANMRKHLESARGNLNAGKAEAAKKGVSSHPEFDTIASGIEKAQRNIAAAAAEVEQSKHRAAADANAVTADVAALKAAYDRVQPVFEKATGSVIHYNDLESAATLIGTIERFEKTELDAVQQQMAAFGETYGTTQEAIDETAEAMGYVNNYYRASFPYTELARGIENVEKTRTVMADDLIRKAEAMKTRAAEGIHDFARLEQHARIRAWGKMAARFDPENSRVMAFNSGIDAWVAADRKALNAKIDQAVFPRKADDAPEDAEALAKKALAFLQEQEYKRAAEKGGELSKVLAVVVTGPWRVFKKNILGEPIQYNLPVATAVQTDSERAKDLVRVYLSTMLTHEMKGVKKAPPYLGATVGNSYYVRASALK
jgi:hypothetical protein